MPNTAAPAATARPMRPVPTMPSCLPRSSMPGSRSGVHPFHPPDRTRRSPSATRRVIARISAHVNSATAAVSTPGVLVTMTPRDRAAARSMLSKPTAMFDTTRSDGPRRVEQRGVDAIRQERDQRVRAGGARSQPAPRRAARPATSTAWPADVRIASAAAGSLCVTRTRDGDASSAHGSGRSRSGCRPPQAR